MVLLWAMPKNLPRKFTENGSPLGHAQEPPHTNGLTNRACVVHVFRGGMCWYIYIYIYIYTYLYIYVYLHTYLYNYVYLDISVNSTYLSHIATHIRLRPKLCRHMRVAMWCLPSMAWTAEPLPESGLRRESQSTS
jgi:type IV secretory pathway VirB3-like protein